MIGSERPDRPRGGRMRIPRSRGAASGFLLILLGLWGALIPFLGPYFDFAFTPDQPWTWTNARGWLEVLPGAVAVIGGLLMLTSRNRATAMLGGWLAVAAGAWFVVGRALAGPLGLGNAGAPVAGTDTKRVWLELTYFYGLGALMVFLGALALGRLSVRSVRDVEYAQRPLTTQEQVQEPVAAPVTHTGEQPVGAPMTNAPTEVITPQQPVKRRRGLRGLFHRDGPNRTLAHR
ncbi:hypothetical protein [Mycolicibacterium litorale]|uniref:Secreted protein n=1 Tax=Mycolicibacterium litorale TaxID=758802 RepID=A0AAD1IK42_9MYCO|nr:hypothetical protein [Mycolicibacterium litorale]MCV7415211.1 hypothetical protein [Mycolicibacterium litorale]TDY08463.1 hypothetical protein BCL50_0527 [Mycolicibacterium litorale]BBY16386.1 hypothetical protein MLIT_19780 [Mycolicibacterium litorale]